MKKDPENKPSTPKKNGKNLRWLYLALAIFLLGQVLFTYGNQPKKTDWLFVKTEILAKNDIEKLEVINNGVVEIYLKKEALEKPPYSESIGSRSGPHYYFNIGAVEVFEQNLAEAQKEFLLPEPIKVEYLNRSNWMVILFSWGLPVLFLWGLWYFVLRTSLPGMGSRTGGNNPFNFGKTSPDILDERKGNKIRFDDVAGLESAKIEVMEIVNFLKNPEVYTRLGAKIPKGVMLVGPPGTGKTLLAKAVAGEAGVSFFSMSGSEFVEMFVGVGASRVRDLFEKAKSKAPSIIFIDEIDGMGRSRRSVNALQANDERESTLNQLLNEMDGFSDNAGVIVLAATNRPDILDKALLRAGRFDRHIYLELPNLTERLAIFKVHTRKIKLSPDVNLEQLAAQTPGFSGADIANMSNEAALIAAREKKETVGPEDFGNAVDRIIGGLERKGKIISNSEKRIIAYHEAGHATVGWFLKHADKLIKVTIVPRGKSLGSAWYLPEERQILTRSQLIDRLCISLGGRAAEKLMLGEISSGAVDDLEKVTKMAYAMVAYYGLSDTIGHLSFYDTSGDYQNAMQKPYSEATAHLIDEEVRQLVTRSFNKTTQILKEHQPQLVALAERLLEKEVVVEAALKELFGERSANILNVLKKEEMVDSPLISKDE